MLGKFSVESNKYSSGIKIQEIFPLTQNEHFLTTEIQFGKEIFTQAQCMKRSAMTRSLTKLDAYVFHYKFKWLTAILR